MPDDLVDRMQDYANDNTLRPSARSLLNVARTRIVQLEAELRAAVAERDTLAARLQRPKVSAGGAAHVWTIGIPATHVEVKP